MQAVISLGSLPQSLPVNAVLRSGEFPQQADHPHLVQGKHLEEERLEMLKEKSNVTSSCQSRLAKQSRVD